MGTKPHRLVDFESAANPFDYSFNLELEASLTFRVRTWGGHYGSFYEVVPL